MLNEKGLTGTAKNLKSFNSVGEFKKLEQENKELKQEIHNQKNSNNLLFKQNKKLADLVFELEKQIEELESKLETCHLKRLP